MKILWITNSPITFHRGLLDKGFNQGGGWIDAAFEAIKDSSEIKLGLATVYSCHSMLKHNENGIKCYALPNDVRDKLYRFDDNKNIQLWKEVADDFKPDIIQIWGSELSHSLCALKALPNIPAIVYMQGLMAQIYNHGQAGIDSFDYLKHISIRSFIENKGVQAKDKFEFMRVQIEKEIIARAGNVFVENDWCAYNCKAINSECKVFKSLLPINRLFSDYTWSADQIIPHSIFTVAGGYPIKGHHFLYKALSIVKNIFPDVKLYIPGYNPIHDDTGIRKLFPSTFTNYLRYLIKKYELRDNIVYVGKLKASEMAEYMSKCHVFVMPSAIENHSSTLLEAMMVGAPCVTSYVGGISQYVRDGENAFFYRYDEPEMLAAIIVKLFDDINLCQKIGQTALEETRKIRLSVDILKDFSMAYKQLLHEK